MPYLSKEQIVEIEHEMADLLEQLKEMNAVKAENVVLRAENLRLRVPID